MIHVVRDTEQGLGHPSVACFRESRELGRTRRVAHERVALGETGSEASVGTFHAESVPAVSHGLWSTKG